MAEVVLPPAVVPTTPPEEVLIAQGAEARVFSGSFLGVPCVIKERFPKAYRHPVLDARLTSERLAGEARCMRRARLVGVDTPEVLYVDVAGWEAGLSARLRADLRKLCEVSVAALLRLPTPLANCSAAESAALLARVQPLPAKLGPRIYMERIAGCTAKAFLASADVGEKERALLAHDVGVCIARLHDGGIVHGDLTTSNMMLRGGRGPLQSSPLQGAEVAAPSPASSLPPSELLPSGLYYPLVMIDFGLSQQQGAAGAEDKAVDLYVLERAVLSAHAADYAPVEASERDGPGDGGDDAHADTAAAAADVELISSGEVAAGAFFSRVLQVYTATSATGPEVSRRFAAVRLRGRKRVAFG